MSFAFNKSPLLALPAIELEPKHLGDDDLIISINKQQVFMPEDSVISAADKFQLAGNTRLLQLGELNQQRLFVHHNTDDIADEKAHEWWNLRRIAAEQPADLASIAGLACSINHWHQHNQFCAKCASSTSLGKEHSRKCMNDLCGDVKFPRVDPSIIVAVVNDKDEILLGRQAGWTEGRYSVLAGFLGHGESLEQCVRREVKEEAGIIVDTVEYIASQPWPFPGSLMIGFQAKARNQTIHYEDDELQDAMWISRQALLDKVESQEIIISPRLSISRYLIDLWLGKT